MDSVLTIAGSDSGGGAGIQADLKVFTALGVFGTSAVTAVTAQDTCGVKGVYEVSVEGVKKQLMTVFDDFNIKAMKTGMLFSKEIIQGVLEELDKNGPRNLVVDPVFVSTNGDLLLKADAVKLLKDELMAASLIITPNKLEAEKLTGKEIETYEDMEEVAGELINHGASNVLLKGGHLEDDYAYDLLYTSEEDKIWLKEEMLSLGALHGTGCSLSAAICAFLGRGFDLLESVKKAKKYTHLAIKNGFFPGKGSRVLDFNSYLNDIES